MEKRIRCVAVDQHPCLLAGLEVVLANERDIELVGSSTSVDDGLEAARTHAPDVTILDGHVSGPDGRAVLDRLRSATPDTAPLVYSTGGDRRLLTDLLEAGVRGYVLKASPAGDLLRAVRTLALGEAYVDPAMSPLLLMDRAAIDAPLPQRERDILQLLAEGLGTDQVAQRLGLSAETVKADTRRAVLRLEATGRVHAVANALRRSYIT